MTTSKDAETIYDIAIIGGGINGCGIARDAAMKGYSVFLCDKGDLGGETSWASTKLIHGGLRYLETYEFSLVKKALHERQKLHKIAPHIISPMRFILPHEKHLRPKWMIRCGLFLYDFLAPKHLEKSTGVNLEKDDSGVPLKDKFKRGFSYSDCRVDDHRLVILNALSAQENGATVQPFTACKKVEVKDKLWLVTLSNKKIIKARSIINATGPWAGEFIQKAIRGVQARHALRLVKGSHIVVPKIFVHDSSYIFQNDDNRIIFAIPYENDFTLIGTTDENYKGDPSEASCVKEAEKYLCDSVNKYFKLKVLPKHIVWSFAGVRPLIEDRSEKASATTRDYRLSLRTEAGAPLLNIWGGKLTTYRTLAEESMAKIMPFLDEKSEPHNTTDLTPLVGGDIDDRDIEAYRQKLQKEYPWLGEKMLERLPRSYGTLCEKILGLAASEKDLGQHFGADLFQAEVDYLIENEWAKSAEAIVWYRTKLGLYLSDDEVEALEKYVQKKLKM